ncbi:hypothetical protein D9756_000580 [Leucocoprinus leucothites]|uniref:A to I editase domain-containing protein n=1 Tax=Leucocoprinus leucothites TaxID=201217 RepID=A0A8H5LMR8_9AGAR|nr:hypothetical protein D9756_000580 [Leucoagaricus leucothites]
MDPSNPGIAQEDSVKAIHDIYANIGFRPPPKQFTILASFYMINQISIVEVICKPVSLATGTKCTPAIKYSPCGELMHDTHAEVLARRGAVRWLMEEIGRLRTAKQYVSDWLVETGSKDQNDSDESPPYRLRPDVSLHMYVSTLPCKAASCLLPLWLVLTIYQGGDASMGYLAATQDAQVALLKSQSAHLFPKLRSHEASRGRDDYNRLGVLRTKPGRADSPPALSMSCSDKIAKWSVLGILGGFASRFLEPVYIESIVIGEFPQNEEEKSPLRELVKGDCERALRTRIGKIEGLPEGYAVHPPDIRFTNIPFIHSKTELDKVMRTAGSCNESLCWLADSRPPEILINGLKRSTAPKNRYVEKYRPLLSRIAMFNLYNQTLQVLGSRDYPLPDNLSYGGAKANSTRYQRAKTALTGPNGPFSGWIRVEPRYQHFTLQGNFNTPPTILSSSST